MKLLKYPITLTLLLTLFLSACNLPLSATVNTPTSNVDLVGTAAASTVQALSTQLAETSKPPATVEPTKTPPQVETPTNTLEPSSTPVTPSPTPVTPTVTAGPFDKLGGVIDITYPDDSTVAPGATFVKTWRITNKGNTTWGSGYAVVFTTGDLMGAPASIPLGSTVPPNGTVDISVTLKAPTTAKSYTGNYKMRNASGVLFGLGTNADQPFWVKVTVSASSSLVFAVISVPTTVDPTNFTGSCGTGKTFHFTAKIKANGPGTVKYHWIDSEGSETAVETLTFSAAGTNTVTNTWKLTSDYTGWQRIYIDSPNHQSFEKADFTLNCT
jgi:hypothetical protein